MGTREFVRVGGGAAFRRGTLSRLFPYRLHSLSVEASRSVE
jgi:hypothetical protein